MPPQNILPRVADPRAARIWLRRALAFGAFASLLVTAWLSAWVASAAPGA